MSPTDRIDVADARHRAQAGQALLVCAYESEERCRRMKLEGSTTLTELRAALDTIPRDRELIFYCA